MHVWTISAKGIKPNDEKCQYTHCHYTILIKVKALIRNTLLDKQIYNICLWVLKNTLEEVQMVKITKEAL